LNSPSDYCSFGAGWSLSKFFVEGGSDEVESAIRSEILPVFDDRNLFPIRFQ
jgi:hypothetical protein